MKIKNPITFLFTILLLASCGGNNNSTTNNSNGNDYQGNTNTNFNNLFVYEEVTGGYALKKYEGNDRRVNIVNSYKGEPVVAILDHAFDNCDNLQTVNIPESVTIIGDYAFYNCIKLDNINLNNNITSIGSSAFENCDSLKSVSIPNEVIEIKDHTFFGCDSLNTIVFGEKTEIIGDNAFGSCEKLKSVNISPSIKTIAPTAFLGSNSIEEYIVSTKNSNYSNYWEEIYFSGNVLVNFDDKSEDPVIISKYLETTSNIDETKDIYLSNAENGYYISYIDDSDMENPVTKYFNLEVIDEKYYVSTSEESATIWAINSEINGLYTTLQEKDFYLVKSINNEAFEVSDVIDLEMEKDENNEDSLLVKLYSLDGETLNSVENPVAGASYKLMVNYRKQLGIYNKEQTKLVTYNSGNTVVEFTILDGVTSIGDYAFAWSFYLNTIIIPEDIEEIGDYAFLYCRNLTSATIPEGVLNVGDNVFHMCDSLNN